MIGILWYGSFMVLTFCVFIAPLFSIIQHFIGGVMMVVTMPLVWVYVVNPVMDYLTGRFDELTDKVEAYLSRF